MPHSVVFDTNILFSAFGWRGNPFECLQLARRRQIESVTCLELLEELEEKLWLKLNISASEAHRASLELLSFSRLLRISHTLKVVEADPDDDNVLECAVAGHASYIVTGDKQHLLPLGNYQGIAIVSPAEFLRLMAAEQTGKESTS